MDNKELRLRPKVNEPFIISYLGQDVVYEIVKVEGQDTYLLMNKRKKEPRGYGADLDTIYAAIDNLALGGLLQIDKNYMN